MPFYKTIVTVTILSEVPIPGHADLRHIEEFIDTGDGCGQVEIGASRKISGKATADALLAMGSEPGFFGLDRTGRRINP
jgi:hypothetical protein